MSANGNGEGTYVVDAAGRRLTVCGWCRAARIGGAARRPWYVDDTDVLCPACIGKVHRIAARIRRRAHPAR